MSNNKYQHVISLGHFCAVASELERLGLREASMPFDWIITPLDSVLNLIENNFNDFLNLNLLKRDENSPYIVINTKYDIAFYHDFKEKKSIEEQMVDVQIKYKRRIDRFYSFINEKTLFVRYIESKEEYEYIKSNHSNILSTLKKYNCDNELILIAKEIKANDIYTIYENRAPYKTHQRFIKINKKLYNTFLNIPYPEDKKRLNLKRYKLSLPHRIIHSTKKTIQKVLRVVNLLSK